MTNPEMPAGGMPALIARARGLIAPTLLAALAWGCTGEVPYAPDPEHDHASHAPAGASAPPARARLRGHIALAPGLALAPGGVARPTASPTDYACLFVIGTRNPDQALAELVQKLPVGELPTSFSLSARDLSEPGVLAGSWYLSVRLDADGAPGATRGDVLGRLGPVEAGADGVHVILDTLVTLDDAPVDHGAHAIPASQPGPSATSPAGGAAAHSQPVGAPARLPGPRMRGTLDIDPQFAELASRGTLFVFLKQGPTRRGMPWASIRYDEPHFPLELDIGPEHVTLDVENKADMLAGELYFMARLDLDRDAMTRSADDIECEPVLVQGDGDSFSTRLDRRSE